MYNSYASPEITNCTFTNNIIECAGGHDGSGGGMYNKDSSPTLTNCTFANNRVNGSIYGHGGGICNNRVSINSPTITLTNCTFSGNSVSGTYGRGGAMYNDCYDPTLTNCTFSGNSASEYGAGMYNNWTSNTTLTNCILWDATTTTIEEIYNYDNCETTIDTCIIQFGKGSISNKESSSIKYINNPITTDPKLQPLADNGGFIQTCKVEEGSSAIGAGKVITDVTTDARGYIRSTTAPTIGAYEYNGIAPSQK